MVAHRLDRELLLSLGRRWNCRLDVSRRGIRVFFRGLLSRCSRAGGTTSSGRGARKINGLGGRRHHGTAGTSGSRDWHRGARLSSTRLRRGARCSGGSTVTASRWLLGNRACVVQFSRRFRLCGPGSGHGIFVIEHACSPLPFGMIVCTTPMTSRQW